MLVFRILFPNKRNKKRIQKEKKKQNYLLELFCKLNGACDGLSKGFGLEHDNGDEGLLLPKFV